MASYGRPSLPFASPSTRKTLQTPKTPKTLQTLKTLKTQPTGIPRPHQWLLMGVQACRLPAPKPGKPSKPLKRLKPLKLSKLCQSVSGQIHCFFWRSSLPFTYLSIHPSIYLSLSLSLHDPPNRGGRRHPGASPFYNLVNQKGEEKKHK